MRTNAWLNLGLAALLPILVVAVDGTSPVQAQTVQTLRRFNVRLIRKAEIVVIPAVGGDVWRAGADLTLPSDFDPNRKAIEITIAAPCPGCSGSAGGAFLEGGEPHITPLRIQQLLPRHGGAWSMKLDVPGNGFCRVVLTPRSLKWTIRARCRGIQTLPPFPETTQFQLGIRIGDDVAFASVANEFRQQKITVRRYP